MGSHYIFKCKKCAHEVESSGKLDYGFFAVVKPFICDNCKDVFDVQIGEVGQVIPEKLLSEMQKVWVMNPLSVSERLACKKDLFDVVIFDEASQIPLEDAVPAIYRSKQIVVVGDEKQMPPSSFFASHSESQTLLDKASLSFSKEMFKWHYRSEHPALIQFSNKQFYEDELLTFPSNSADFPINFNFK